MQEDKEFLGREPVKKLLFKMFVNSDTAAFVHSAVSFTLLQIPNLT